MEFEVVIRNIDKKRTKISDENHKCRMEMKEMLCGMFAETKLPLYTFKECMKRYYYFDLRQVRKYGIDLTDSEMDRYKHLVKADKEMPELINYLNFKRQMEEANKVLKNRIRESMQATSLDIEATLKIFLIERNLLREGTITLKEELGKQ
jgi:hypothetical protein